MRFFEFSESEIDPAIADFVLLLHNLRGSAESKESAGFFNWAALDEMTPKFQIDYEVFDKIYQQHKNLFEPIVHDYSGDGVQLNVPGTNKDTKNGDDPETSQDKVDDIAASAAEKNLD